MAALNVDENLPFEADDSQVEQSSESFGTNSTRKTDDFYDFEPNKEEKDNIINGETENELSQNLDHDNSHKHKNYTNNYKLNDNKSQKCADKGSYRAYNDYSRPAGLSSDRCVRDFLSSKYKKYHWDQAKMSESTPSRSNTATSEVSNKDATGLDRDNNEAKEIFKLNYLMRRENRIRNMSHSDIFGASEMSNKRPLSNSADASSYSSSTTSGNIDLCGIDYRISKRFRSNGSKTTSSEKIYDAFKSYNTLNKPKDSDTVEGDGSRIGLNVIQLSGLKSNASEKQLINFCDCCKLNVVSISIDRNILTHSCTGTGTIKVRSSKCELDQLKEVLKQNGYDCKVK